MSARRYEIPKGTSAGKCKDCQEYIYWIKTWRGKNIPVNADGICHFDTCTRRGQIRQKPKIVIAPAKFLPLLNDLKDAQDAIEEKDADGHGFVERLLLLKDDNQLHQITQDQFEWLERLHEEYCA
jgi:hypothetical protein